MRWMLRGEVVAAVAEDRDGWCEEDVLEEGRFCSQGPALSVSLLGAFQGPVSCFSYAGAWRAGRVRRGRRGFVGLAGTCSGGIGEVCLLRQHLSGPADFLLRGLWYPASRVWNWSESAPSNRNERWQRQRWTGLGGSWVSIRVIGSREVVVSWQRRRHGGAGCRCKRRNWRSLVGRLGSPVAVVKLEPKKDECSLRVSVPVGIDEPARRGGGNLQPLSHLQRFSHQTRQTLGPVNGRLGQSCTAADRVNCPGRTALFAPPPAAPNRLPGPLFPLPLLPPRPSL